MRRLNKKKMNKLPDELKLLCFVSNHFLNGTYTNSNGASSARASSSIWLCRIVISAFDQHWCVCVCTAAVAVLNNSLEVVSRLPSETNIIRLLRCQFKRVFGELLPFRESHPVPIFFGIVKYEKFSISRMHRHKQTKKKKHIRMPQKCGLQQQKCVQSSSKMETRNTFKVE